MNNTNTNDNDINNMIIKTFLFRWIHTIEKRQCPYAAPKKIKIQKNTDCGLEQGS